MTYELATEGRAGIVLVVPSLLHLLPPLLEALQAILAVKLGEQLPPLHRPYAPQPIGVIAAEQVGELHEFVAVQAELAVQVAHEVALDHLVVVEHVAVNARAAEEEDIRVVRDDAVDEAAREQLGALRFRFLRCRNEWDAKEDE